MAVADRLSNRGTETDGLPDSCPEIHTDDQTDEQPTKEHSDW